jgi:hypothetical protein
MPIGKPVSVQLIERRIYLIRGQKVMLDSGLAELYGVSTKVFNQAVKRNRERFPPRLHVPGDGRRSKFFEVTDCDLEPGTRRKAVLTLCVH